MKKFIIILVFFFSPAILPAQTAYVKTIFNDSINNKDAKKFKRSKKNIEIKEIEKYSSSQLSTLHSLGYLTANLDSISVKDSIHLEVYFTCGKKYRWREIRKGNINNAMLDEIKLKKKSTNNTVIQPSGVFQLHEKLIKYNENNGYPFASVKFDSVKIENDFVSAALNLEKGPKISIDSIFIKGSVSISKIFLYNYLSIKPGMLYDESVLSKMSVRLKELPFVKSMKPSEIIFTEKNANVYLFLDHKKSSELDGLLGFLPDNNTGKLLITGQAHMLLLNPFAHGETIELDWRRLQEKTQDLKARLVYPFLFSTPFGTDINFKIYKRDTSFIDINQNVGLQYILSGGNYFKVFANNRNTSLISTQGLEKINELPPYADIQTLLYGIGFKNEQLDYRFNPRKGFRFNVNTSAGFKNIRKNEKLNPAVYEDLELKTAQYTYDYSSDFFFPLKRRATINVGFEGAGIIGKNIFVNELYRIGGLKSLRGFNEESIFASSFNIASLEYRFLLDQNSYWYAFVDGAYYENKSINARKVNNGSYVSDTPFGFGTGVSFETKAGIFSINYALGREFNNPIDLRSAKIHFGIVSIF